MDGLDNFEKNEKIELSIDSKDLISIEGSSGIDEVKNSYEKIREKYSLPSFNEINSDFQIEKIVDLDVEFLIRRVREYVGDKISIYFKFIENLIQPSNAQMFVFMIIKKLEKKDVLKLRSIYEKLAVMELELIELDLVFDAEKEAEFIRNAFLGWQEIKVDLYRIIGSVKKKGLEDFSSSGEKKYFG